MDDFDYGPPNGFVLRRNTTCAANEQNCTYNPWGGNQWHNCCPLSSHCTGDDDYICCPTESGCRVNLTQDPHCANNETWNLWINNFNEGKDEHYFCCPPDQIAFLQNLGENDGVGCADPPLTESDQKTLSLVARGTPSASRTLSTTATPTGTPVETPAETDTDTTSSTGSTNKGAIAGGVVGGCAGLALIIGLVWFLLYRRRKQAAPAINPNASTPAEEYKSAPKELADSPARVELPSPNGMAHELPANEH